MMKKIFMFILGLSCLYSLNISARSRQVYIYFLSEAKVSLFESVIYFSPPLASRECQKVEGGCFDPQRGFVEGDISIKKIPADLGAAAFTADLVKCDKDNYFDIYCGKSKNIKRDINQAIWIDVSGSMRAKDMETPGGFCQRRKIVERLQQQCPGKFAISHFNTALRAMGSYDELCRSSGTNNTKTLIRWIESSRYHKLYIVTDKEELNQELATYLDKIHAHIFGDKDNLEIDNLAISCN